MTQNEHQMQAALTVSVTATATMRIRTNLSIGHLIAAGTFSRATEAVEEAHKGEGFSDFWDDIQSNAIATILTSVAALEAYANELFVDHATVFSDLREEVMKKLWELYEMKKTLEKFQFALLLRGKSQFDTGRSPFQDIVVLIKLRNALIDYKPEWSDEVAEQAKLSRVLIDRAVTSPFFPADESLFPKAWASRGTTRWAVKSVVDFLLEFERLAALETRIGSFVERVLR